VRGHFADFLALEHDPPARAGTSLKWCAQGGLAGAGSRDERHDLAGVDMQHTPSAL